MSEKSKAGGKKPAASSKKATTKPASAKKSVAKKTPAKKTTAKKTPAKKATAAKPQAAATSATKSVAKPAAKPRGGNGMAPEERWRRIAEVAYLRAEARGFEGGDPTADWLAAEAEVDASLRH